MASRLIRDEMLDSERVQEQPLAGRWLFVTMLLLADDVGLLELSLFKLSRKAHMVPSDLPDLIDKMVEKDLLRIYESHGKRYAFIPRFRQRLRVKRAKHPLPPDELMAGDDDASSKINGLTEKVRTDDRTPPTSARKRRPEPEPEPEYRKNPPATRVPPAEREKRLGLEELKAEGVDEAVGRDWLKVRKAKKAPLTETAWAAVKREAALAKMTPAQAVKMATENSWQGFKASWIDRAVNNAQPTETAFQRGRREAVERMTGGLVSKRAPTQTNMEVFDVIPDTTKRLD